MDSKNVENKKNKKTGTKKENLHEIPVAKTAVGRRPHTETVAEPYQPSLLSESDLIPEGTPPPSVQAALEQQKGSVNTASKAEAEATEVILEGQPAPRPKKNKVDLKEPMETVIGALQLGATVVKGTFPKPFEIAEKVVEDWKHDGDFSELPVNQPLVQFYLGLGLRKAKQTEKNIEQKLEVAGVLPVVRQQWQKAQKYFKS